MSASEMKKVVVKVCALLSLLMLSKDYKSLFSICRMQFERYVI